LIPHAAQTEKKRNQNKQAQQQYHPGRGPCPISIIPKQSQEHPSSIANTGRLKPRTENPQGLVVEMILSYSSQSYPASNRCISHSSPLLCLLRKKSVSKPKACNEDKKPITMDAQGGISAM
jgi:hypothetical protein